jgi:predicted permease
MGLWNRIRNRRFDDDLREELREHEAMKRDALQASGMSSAEAAAAARRAMGNTTLMREDARAVWIARWVDSIVQDLRYAVRSLAAQPVHTATSIAVLVLAFGLNASLFTLFKGVTLAPWPAVDPDRVIEIGAWSHGRQLIAPSFDEYRFVREQATTLKAVAAYAGTGFQLRLQVPGLAETYPRNAFVTANFLPLLGAPMHLGTGFIPEDDLPGARRAVAVLGHFHWRTLFSSDPAIVGRVVSLDKKPFTIIGVLDPRIDGLHREIDIWLPMSALAAVGPVMSGGIEPRASGQCCVRMVGRLADGVRAERAREELQLLHERFATATKRPHGAMRVRGTAQFESLPQDELALLGAVAGAVLLILALGCANVGNLQLARGLARRREISTRIALGASRARIVRQLMVEAVVLASIAGGTSVALAAVLPGVVMRLAGDEIPPGIAGRFVPDVNVLLFTALISALACLVFALTPALHATRATIPLSAMDRGGTRGSRFPLRSTLLAVQIAACTVLLAGAALVTRSIMHAMSVNPGFDLDAITKVVVSLPSETPSKEYQAFARQLLASLEAQGEPVAMAPHGPLNDAPFVMDVIFTGENPDAARMVRQRGASNRYFEVLKLPMVAGRMYKSDATGEAVVNEAFARTHWPGSDPLRQTLRQIDRKGAVARTYAVVGVVRDAYLTGFDKVIPLVFTPTASVTYMTNGGPATVERVRAAALTINDRATVRAYPARDDVREMLEDSRTGAAFAWAMGILGLVLATVGVFGVFAYAVEERRREIGVRMALGAARRQIITMVLSSSSRAAIVGLGAGIALSLACGPVLGSMLHGLSPLDPISYGMMLGALGVAGFLATAIPARRACRVDPAITLREEG